VKTVRKVTRIDGNNALQAFKPKVRVAAYCRVSTDSDEQMASLEAQKDHYESYIKTNPDWEFAGIYYDEGISGTKKENGTAMDSGCISSAWNVGIFAGQQKEMPLLWCLMPKNYHT
jgi:hypothetical protein